MKTLIELYDTRAIENVIGPEVFRPQKVVYLCPDEYLQDGQAPRNIRNFFLKRGLEIETEFLPSSLYKTDKLLRQLRKIAEENSDLAIDVTGGTDAALFASGMFCQETNAAAFTYSRRKNRFYDIQNAPFPENLPCELQYSVEDFFVMTGGKLRKGRVDNRTLSRYFDIIDPFFQIYCRFQNIWNSQIVFMQRISQNRFDEPISLYVEGAPEQKGDHGGRVRANYHVLRQLQDIGMISDLRYKTDVSVSFRFRDEQVRYWLRDVGSVLELYMYKACMDSGVFHDCISSAVVDWDDVTGHASVYNEIDVVATRGVIPLFISCKTCEVKTEALNELAILANRFGGKGAKAAIVTTEPCRAAARHRAAQLGITVIDLEELISGRTPDRLQVIMHVKDRL